MKPMLAATVEDIKQLKFPLLGSPKLDGIRALVIDGVLMSRNLKPIPNASVQRSLPLKRMQGWDGELIVGKPEHKDCFRTTTSGVMSEDGEPNFTFWVFDYIDPLPFKDRYKGLQHNVRGLVHPRVRIVPQIKLEDAFAVHQYEDIMLKRGYEGIMLRTLDGVYKYGRSTVKEGHLMKLKRFADSEAVIVGAYELMRNDNEATTDALGRTKRSSHKANKHGRQMLGGFMVEDVKTGVRFDLGTGFDDKTRKKIWDRLEQYVGTGVVVKYKYQPTGVKEKPRFPVFLGFRED